MPTSPPREALQLEGMQVRPPARFAWYRHHRGMEHWRMAEMRPPAVWEPTSLIRLEVPCCRTDLPSTPCLELPCPCGEVIWDMSTCTAWPPRTLWDITIVADPSRTTGHAPGVSGRRVCPPVTDEDPLPPLDGLDEGLTCCGRRFGTFKAYLAHRRTHGAMGT